MATAAGGRDNSPAPENQENGDVRRPAAERQGVPMDDRTPPDGESEVRESRISFRRSREAAAAANIAAASLEEKMDRAS